MLKKITVAVVAMAIAALGFGGIAQAAPGQAPSMGCPPPHRCSAPQEG
ncbi:MAG TPA: hypothetical protein VGH89_03285 [Pseudonocardia sp.]|jgi:hypothetical protein